MWLGILGPLQVRLEGKLVPIAAAKQRIVLAALLLHGNRPVSFDDLAAFVWGGSPPPAARVTLRNYIKRLRQAFGPELAARIRTSDPGYLIELDESELDLSCFVHRCEAGGAAVRAGQWQRAQQELDQALLLWRSAPLDDVPSELLRGRELPRLEQLRLQALEWQMETRLRLGQHGELVVPLRSLAEAHPLRERFRAQLMLALYRCGRQAEALAAYRDARRVLVGELGVEPGPELQQLQRRILAGDEQLWQGQPPAGGADRHLIVVPGARRPPGQSPGGGRQPRPADPARRTAGTAVRPGAARGRPDAGWLPDGAPTSRGAGSSDAADSSGRPPGAGRPPAGARPHAASRSARGGPPQPRQLPFDVRQFAGRAAELTALTGFLDEAAGLSVVTAVGGCGGVGKTALAVHWAHQVADRFPDGQIYLNLRGHDPALAPLTPADALVLLLSALGVPRGRMPGSLDEQAALYRSLVSDRRMLILLDNARASWQVRPLLPGSRDSMVLVTGRSDFVGLVANEGARLLTVGLLSHQESAELLAARLGQDWLNGEPAQQLELISLCGRLPLALSIAAARLAGAPERLGALIGELSTAGGLLDGLTGDDQLASVRAVLSWSCDAMTEQAARMFRLLSVHPGPDISAAAAASLAGVTQRAASRALGELCHAHALQQNAQGRSSFHDLLRAFAAEQAAEHDGDRDRAGAVNRVLDYYLGSAHHAAGLLFAPRDPISLSRPARGVRPERFGSPEQALAWLEAERWVLIAVIGLAADSGLDQQAEKLAWLTGMFLERQGYWVDWDEIQHIALASAQRAGDPAGIARAHRSAGTRSRLAGRYDDAHRHLQLALDLERQLGNQLAQAAIHLGIVAALDQQGRHAEAVSHVSQALAGYRSVGDRRGQASALGGLSWCHSRLGQYAEAIHCCERAIGLQRQLGDQLGEAGSWDSLGCAHHHLGRYRQAVGSFRRALDLLVAMGARYPSAVTLMHLGDSYVELGDPHAAGSAWQQALAIMTELDHPDAERVRAKLAQVPQPAA
jgi:DNA-binding SARP family transcriptional activator/tetratricopeptide (TPR) repeat protein